MNFSSIHSVVELCQALVQIPSENPSGSSTRSGEKIIAEFVGGFLENLGAKVEYEEIEPDRPNVYGFWPAPAGATQRIMFAPHLDTVTVDGMVVDPFLGKISDGKIYGRGSSDTKGSMAAMLWALRSVDLSQLDIAVAFAGLVVEEAGQLGAKACAARKFADFVVVGEPTSLDVVYTHKGTAWLEIETVGKSVHASLPETGVNAIDLMTDALKRLREEFPNILPLQKNTILGRPSISTGRIRGGVKINVVPDRCYAEIDIRILPGQESMAAAVADFFRGQQIPATVHPIKISAPLYTDSDNPIIEKFTSLGARLTGASWFCDAAFFSVEGTPAIAIGPGSIAQAHTADEFIEVAELERGAEFFTNFLRTFSNGRTKE
jgi:acetylornithine deacetylase/succinyl-diaminopimelate desuccinylase-like protein